MAAATAVALSNSSCFPRSSSRRSSSFTQSACGTAAFQAEHSVTSTTQASERRSSNRANQRGVSSVVPKRPPDRFCHVSLLVLSQATFLEQLEKLEKFVISAISEFQKKKTQLRLRGCERERVSVSVSRVSKSETAMMIVHSLVSLVQSIIHNSMCLFARTCPVLFTNIVCVSVLTDDHHHHSQLGKKKKTKAKYKER